MKKFKILFTILALIVVASSCETYDDYNTSESSYIGFGTPNVNLKVRSGGTRDKHVTVFVTEAASVDRTFTVSVVADKTEVAAENYTFDSNVSIPANERSFDFTITGVDVSLTDEKLPLVLKVDPKDGVLSGGQLTVTLFK